MPISQHELSSCGYLHKVCIITSPLEIQDGVGGIPEAPPLAEELLTGDSC